MFIRVSAGLQPCPDCPPRPEKRSFIHTFSYPAQDFKLKAGDQPQRAITLEPAARVGERALIALAAFCGTTRLIDNLVLGEDAAPTAGPLEA